MKYVKGDDNGDYRTWNGMQWNFHALKNRREPKTFTKSADSTELEKYNSLPTKRKVEFSRTFCGQGSHAKALGTGIGQVRPSEDNEVLNDASGKPVLVCKTARPIKHGSPLIIQNHDDMPSSHIRIQRIKEMKPIMLEVIHRNT